MKQAVLFILMSLFVATSHGETSYVIDQFTITMRSGESTSHKIIRSLPSGTQVEVLSRNPDTGYSRVQARGTTGFVLSRQLMAQPSARSQLEEMERRLRELQAAPGELSSKLTKLQTEHGALQQTHNELQQVKRELEQELESIRRTAGNAVRISKERNELQKNVATLTRELEDLKQENRDLHNQTAQNWFLIGAGVVIVGIILGLILPHLRFQRRKSSWGSL